MKIILDKREKNKNLINFLKGKYEVEVSTLETGDIYIIDKDVYIEHKSYQDLLDSFFSDRLVSQFERLSNLKSMYIITGKIEELWRKDLTPAQFSGRMDLCIKIILEIQLRGIPVIVVNNNLHNISVVIDHISGNNLEFTRKNTKINHPNEFVSFLTGIEGIGVKKAEKLASEYKDIIDLANNVDKIKMSSKLIDNIRKSLNLSR